LGLDPVLARVTITPMKESTNCKASLCEKIPTTDAKTTPMSPMNRNCPNPARLRRVVVPYAAIPPNMPAVIKNVLATDSPVSCPVARRGTQVAAVATDPARRMRAQDFRDASMGKEQRGFASMDRDKQREIARKGGKAAHGKGTAHEWNSEQAREAGRKGGNASHLNRQPAAQSDIPSVAPMEPSDAEHV
jgi:general stress protein YciG